MNFYLYLYFHLYFYLYLYLYFCLYMCLFLYLYLLSCVLCCSHFSWARRLRILSHSSAVYQVISFPSIVFFLLKRLSGRSFFFNCWLGHLTSLGGKNYSAPLLMSRLCISQDKVQSPLMKMSFLDLLLSSVTHLTWVSPLLPYYLPSLPPIPVAQSYCVKTSPNPLWKWKTKLTLYRKGLKLN